VADALDAFVNGNDPRSLRERLAGSDAAEVRLLDAWAAGSGLLAALQQYEQAISYVADGFHDGGRTVALHRLAALRNVQASATAAASEPFTSYPTDVDLAKKMQLYEVVKLFGETVIGPTAQTWGLYVGTIAGGLGLAGVNLPVATYVGAVLSVLDFAVNKIYLGLLPARVTEFELALASAQLAPGETTDAFLHLTVVNDPPSIGIQDFIGLILTGLGLPEAPEIESLREAFTQAASFFVQLIQTNVSAYAGGCPGCNLDIDVASMPALRWKTTIHDPRLVERRTSTPSVIQGRTDQVNWKARENASGDEEIFAHTAFGPEVLLIPVPSIIGYTPGAFGVDNDTTSNILTVHVSSAPGIGVTVAPRPNSVVTGSLTRFTAGVTGIPNTAVAWSATCGEITESGLYTAPSTAGICSVTATSVADANESDTALFNVVLNDVVQATILACDTGSVLTCSPGHGNVSWIEVGGELFLGGDLIAPLGSAATFGPKDFTACDPADTTNCVSQSIKVELSKPTSTTVRIAIRFVSTGDLSLASLARAILYLRLQTPGPGDFRVHEEGKALLPTYPTFAAVPYRLAPVRGVRTESSLGKINPFDPKPVWDGSFGTGRSTAVLQVAPDLYSTPSIGWDGTIEITLEWLGCPWPSC
jgi:hypothetical protein